MPRLAPLQWLGIVVLAGYGLWLVFFFGRVRPWLMANIGRRLGVAVEESLDVDDAGQFRAAGPDAGAGHQALVSAADLALLLVGTAGVAALVFVPTFLIAESGRLLPLEGRLTGRVVTLDLPASVSMRAAQGTARLRATVHNHGHAPESTCRLSVADYSARNGYLTGSSEVFDLGRGVERELELALRAMRPPAGTHAFRVKLECGQERLLVRPLELRVTP